MIEYIKNLIEEENEKMTEKDMWREYEFKYLGYTAKVVRYEQYGHLCGYIKKDFMITDDVHNTLDKHAHGGITYHGGDKYDNWIGFDCNHAWDFNLDIYLNFEKYGFPPEVMMRAENETYRDMEYVTETLKNMITAVENMEDK